MLKERKEEYGEIREYCVFATCNFLQVVPSNLYSWGHGPIVFQGYAISGRRPTMEPIRGILDKTNARADTSW